MSRIRALRLQDRAKRRRDVAGRKTSGCNLVEKRLKEVKVPLVNNRNVNRRTAECLGCV